MNLHLIIFLLFLFSVFAFSSQSRKPAWLNRLRALEKPESLVDLQVSQLIAEMIESGRGENHEFYSRRKLAEVDNILAVPFANKGKYPGAGKMKHN